MTHKPSPFAIGLFVLSVIGIAVAMALFFSGNTLFSDTTRVELVYDTSIKGLNVGAPVAIRGVKIGEVISIKAKVYEDRMDFFTSVVVAVDKNSLERVAANNEQQTDITDLLLERGLGAQLRMQSLLTGLLYIEVDIFSTDLPTYKDVPTEYPQFPTVPTDIERITEQIERLDLAELVTEFRTIIANINKTVSNPDFQNIGSAMGEALSSLTDASHNLSNEMASLRASVLPVADQTHSLLKQINQDWPGLADKLDGTLSALHHTVAKLDHLSDKADYALSDDSPLLHQLNDTLGELETAAQNLSNLSETLERQPESLLRGKRGS